MVDTNTFNQLSDVEQYEYRRYSSTFIKGVMKSGAVDGVDFSNKYQVYSDGEFFYLASSMNARPFAGITSRYKSVIEALLRDAVQNYGR